MVNTIVHKGVKSVTVECESTEQLLSFLSYMELWEAKEEAESAIKLNLKEEQKTIESKILKACNVFLNKELSISEKQHKRYKVYQDERIIPLRVIQQRCSTVPIKNLKEVIDNLISEGKLKRVDDAKRRKLGMEHKWSNFMNTAIFELPDYCG